MLKRIRDLFIKVISVKVLLWYIPATVLLCYGFIESWQWLLISGLVFVVRFAEKVILKLADKWPGIPGIPGI